MKDIYGKNITTGDPKYLHTLNKNLLNQTDYDYDFDFDIEEYDKTKHKCTLDAYSKPRIIWYLFICFLVCYSIIVIPLQLGYDVLNHGGWFVFDIFSDCCFMIDVILNFFTSYSGEQGRIWDLKTISIHYLKKWFIVDFVSSIPFELYAVNKYFKLLKLLKILRLFRLYKLYRQFKIYRFFNNIKIHSISTYSLMLVSILFLFSNVIIGIIINWSLFCMCMVWSC